MGTLITITNHNHEHVIDLIKKRRYSIANTLGLRLCCIKPAVYDNFTRNMFILALSAHALWAGME